MKIILLILKKILGVLFLIAGINDILKLNSVLNNSAMLIGHIFGTIICFLIAYWGLKGKKKIDP